MSANIYAFLISQIFFSLPLLRKELRQPLEAIGVTHSPDHGAHVHFDRADTGVLIGLGVLAVCVHKSEGVLELFLRCSGGHIDLVAQDEEGDVGQLVGGEEGIELLLGLGETSPIDGIDEVNDAVDGGEIVLPQATGGLVSAEVEGLELDLADDQLVGVGVERRDVDLYAILLEHVQECGLAGIVQPQEQNFGILVIES